MYTKVSAIEYKISKVCYFSFSFKLNEKNSVVKKYGLATGVTRKFLLEEGFETVFFLQGPLFLILENKILGKATLSFLNE